MKKYSLVSVIVFLVLAFFIAATPLRAAAADFETQQQLASLSAYLNSLKSLLLTLQNILFSPIPSAYATSSTPVILSSPTPGAYGITGTSAQITWYTDIAAESEVYYGTSNTPTSFPGYSASRCDGGGNVTSHCVNLTGLTSATTYYFKVVSCLSGQGCPEGTGYPPFYTGTSGGGSTTCPSNIATLLGSGCHDMFTGYYFNTAMDQYVPYSGSAVSYCSTTYVSGCSGSTSGSCGSYTTQSSCTGVAGCSWNTGGNYCSYATSTTATYCPTNIATLLGTGCHDMYTGSYFNTAMTQYVPYGGSAVYSCSTTWVSGCSTSGGTGCGSLYTQTACTPVSGCSWNTTGNYCYYTATSTTSVPGIPTMSVPSASGIPVNISWSVPTGASWYNLSRRTPAGSTNAWTLAASALSSASYSDSTVYAGASYDYRVTACNSYGCSADSSSGSVTISGGTASSSVPSVASVLSVPSTSGAPVTLSWSNVSGATYYQLFRRTPPGTGTWVLVYSPTILSIYDTGVSPGVNYEYKIQACNTYGCSADSNSASVTISGGSSVPSTAPSLSAPSPAPTPVSLSWTSVSGATFYSISRAQQGYGWISAFATTTGASYFDYWPSAGYTINYKVNACNTYGCSADSNVAAVSITSSGSGPCTGLTINFANNKTSYVQGDTVTYTFACTPGGTASFIEESLQKPDGSITVYGSTSGLTGPLTLGIVTNASVFTPGNYTLRTCFTAGCSGGVTASAPFTVAITSGGTTATSTISGAPANCAAVALLRHPRLLLTSVINMPRW